MRYLLSYLNKNLCIRGMWVVYFSINKLLTLHAINTIALKALYIQKYHSEKNHWEIMQIEF